MICRKQGLHAMQNTGLTCYAEEFGLDEDKPYKLEWEVGRKPHMLPLALSVCLVPVLAQHCLRVTVLASTLCLAPFQALIIHSGPRWPSELL